MNEKIQMPNTLCPHCGHNSNYETPSRNLQGDNNQQNTIWQRPSAESRTNRLVIVSMHFLFKGARVFQPANWRTGKSALRYLKAPFYFETIRNFTLSRSHYLILAEWLLEFENSGGVGI